MERQPIFTPQPWASFEAPSGAFNDAGHASARAQVMSEAVRASVNGISRAFEQMMDARVAEKAMRADQEFRAAQAERGYEEAKLRDQGNDMRHLERVEREIELKTAADAEAARIQQQMLADAARTEYDARFGVPSMESQMPFPPVGWLRIDPSSFMPQRPPQPGLTREMAGRMTPERVAAFHDDQARAAELAQSNQEQAAKAAETARAAQAATADAVARINAAPVSDSVKKALLGTAVTDPTRAMTDLTDILTTDERTQASIDAKSKEDGNRREHNFGGGTLHLPISAFPDSEQYLAVQGALDKIPADAKAALEIEAERMAYAGISRTDQFTAAVLDGTIPGIDEEMIKAAASVLKKRAAETYQKLGLSLGWKDEAMIAREKMAEVARSNRAVPFEIGGQQGGRSSPSFTAPSAAGRMTSEDYARKLAMGGVRDEAKLDRMVEEYEATGRSYLPPIEEDAAVKFLNDRDKAARKPDRP